MRFGIRTCAGGYVSLARDFRGRCKFGIVFFSRRVTSAVYFVSLFMFLSFSLFYLEGYRSDRMISPLVTCLAILRFNRVLLSERFKLFSMLSRRLLHNLI